MVGPILPAARGWLDGCDFLVKFAAFPGMFIFGGLLFLVNGCVEYYADILPRKYRRRPSQEAEWRNLYSDNRMESVLAALKHFALAHGFEAGDAFQFRPDDRAQQLLSDFYPGRTAGPSNPDADIPQGPDARLADFVAIWLEKAPPGAE